MTNNFHDLITRMANELDEYRRLLLDDCTVTHRLSNEARVVLGEADEPAVPQGREPASATEQPVDGEVAELVETLKGIAYWRRHGKPGEPAPTSFDIRQADRLDRAAELLERLSPPQPVPASERLPEPEDCDAEGRCWFGTPGCDVWGASWVLRKRSHQRNGITSWLPAHALPLPEVNNG